MVKINKVYTKSGDDGTTALGFGGRTSKTSPRVEAYGTVDEANATIGLAVIESDRAPNAEMGALLRRIQNDLFDVGADLCVPVGEADRGEHPPLRVQPSQTESLEREIDRCNERLETLTSFVLPGGSALAAALHVARTTVRRAERRTVSLMEAEPQGTNPETVRYLNRLSDLLFVLGRAANDDGRQDVLWKPGANR